MNKAQKTVVWFFAIAIIAIAALFAVYILKNGGDGNDTGLPDANVLYYREDCPHCKIVEAFVEDNNVTGKMGIVQKEVMTNQTNKDEFKKVAESCQIDLAKAGVPFFYSGGEDEKKCLMGDTDIINFMKERLNITEASA